MRPWREEQYVAQEMADEVKADNRFLHDEQKLVMAWGGRAYLTPLPSSELWSPFQLLNLSTAP